VYFELAAKCADGLSAGVSRPGASALFAGLPMNPSVTVFTSYLRSADSSILRERIAITEQLIQIRTFLVHQLSGTRVFGWNKAETKPVPRCTSRMPSGATASTITNSVVPSNCLSATPSFEGRPFLPLLEIS